MSIIDRVKNICLTPATEWRVIAEETTSPGELVSGYVAPLAAVGAVAGFIGGSIIGRSFMFMGTYRVPIATGLGMAVFMLVMAIIGVFVLSFIINALAPTFGATQNSSQALKVAVYSYTPGWVAGVLQILPMLGVLAILGSLYGLYLLYLGLPVLMKVPQEKALGYTIVVVICAIVLSVVVASVGALAGLAGAGMIGGGMFGSSADVPAQDVQVDKDSPLGRLQDLGKAMEESGRKMEAAEKSGDSAAQVAAAMEGLGALLGGGRRVDPVEIEQLKPFVPETFAGLKRTRFENEKTGVAGLMISRSQATYGDGGDKRVTLTISDTGGASGLVALAGWAGIQTTKEDDNGFERTMKQGGRIVHEKSVKNGSNEFAMVLGERFVVDAEGSGVGLAELRAAVSSLSLSRLEAMKDLGVKKP